MKKTSKNLRRLKRKVRIRKKIMGTPEKPRMCVFRSAKHIYAQIVDDTCGKTLVAASTVEKEFSDTSDKKSQAVAIGKVIASRALEKGIKTIVFDRSGYLYHGRIKSLTDGAREAGLEF